MEEYPEELRTPPVSLVAVVGCPELHTAISTQLHSEQPPINTLALSDFSKISVIAKTPNEADADPSGQFTGILKRDWLFKHRTRVPSSVAAIFSSDNISGDPAQWLQVCTDLENLKAVIRGRNMKLVLVLVVQSTCKDDISEDRMSALRKRAEVDSKYVVSFDPNNALELQQSLNRLGNTFAELANTYYRDEGRRIKMRLDRKSISSVELSIRYCFKVAVYAEFRRDWVEALRMYEEAYSTLREMIGTSTRLPPIQRLVEVKTVAEQLHFKISTLLLHGGKVSEAITWFRQHSASYKKLVGEPEVKFLHWEWLSRQFLVFGELLEMSSASIQSISSPVLDATERPSEWEFSSAYYYQLAAQYLKEKRSCLELTLSMSETYDIDSNAESVSASVYVGQFARLLALGDTYVMQNLTDEEYVRYALSEGKRFQDSFEIMALLRKSFESYTNSNAHRMASCCGFEMAREYFAGEDYNNAKQIFYSIASLYRKEGWVSLLWEVLSYLQECSRILGKMKDFVECSLEMAALPVSSIASVKECGPASDSRRETIQTQVFDVVRGETCLASNEGIDNLKVILDQPLQLEIDLVSPLRFVLVAAVAFHEQIVKPGAPTLITLSLVSQLPRAVEIDQLYVQFNQWQCNFTILNDQRPKLDEIYHQIDQRVETAPGLVLLTNKWLRLTYDIKSEQSGKLECISVIARLGPYFTICCTNERTASLNDLSLWKFESCVETFLTKDPGLAFSAQKFTRVEEPDPQVDLTLGTSVLALVGEIFIVPVTISAMAHCVYSGEVKINLVDTRGGGLMSPREVDPTSTDNLHVELVGISGVQCEDESRSGIEKIQHSFGLISVPFLNEGESWSCNLEIRWHRPKPIMLYVSLGYSTSEDNLSIQKVHVHRNLEIQGKTAVVFRHHYMWPFRRDPLLLKAGDQMSSLPLNETSILIITVKNSVEVPLRLLSMCIEVEDDSDGGKSWDSLDTSLLVPGETFKKVFPVTPELNVPTLNMGTIFLRWRRDCGSTESEVVTKYRLGDIKVESPPLVVILECPPHAVLGNPFMYFVKIQNRTHLLEEIKFSLADSQSFVLSGSNNDTVFILPKSQHILCYKLVPLVSGSQLLPRVNVTSVRYSTVFRPSVTASSIFVFPSKPLFETTDL